METTGYEINDILVISKSEPRLYVYPNSKKERISFTAFDLTNHKEISVIANRNVKYYLKKTLKPNEMWRLRGDFNMDKSTLYLEQASKLFDERHTKEVAQMIIDYWESEGKLEKLRE